MNQAPADASRLESLKTWTHAIVTVWFIYRIWRGWSRLNRDQSMYA